MRSTRIRVTLIAGILLACFWSSAILAPRALPPDAPKTLGAWLGQAPRLLNFSGVPVSAQGLSNINPNAYFVGPGSCNTTVSGNGTGTNGLTTVGASGTPVVQAQTTATGTNTHNFFCNIAPPSFIVSTGVGYQIVDAVFLYGVQTTALGTQVATLGSGTMNSVIVFSTITYPTPAASETASTVTPVRGDSGTLVITPVVASFNVATTTAGAFFSARFAPATGTLPFKTDLRQLLLSVALLNTATSATITNSPGVIVHYRST